MSNSSFEIKLNTDKPQISDPEVQAAVDMLTKDLSKLGLAEINTMNAYDAQKKTSADLSANSNNANTSVWNTMVTAFMDESCNIMGGVITCVAIMMDVVSDCVNLLNISDNDLMNCVDNTSDMASLKGFTDAINVFDQCLFDVTIDGKTTKGVKLLPTTNPNGTVNDSILCSSKFWPAGKAPMDAHNGALLETSIKGVEESFTNWGSSYQSSMMNDIKKWTTPTSSNGIQNLNNGIDQITKLIDEAVDELGTSNTELQNELTTLVTQMQDMQGSWNKMQESLSAQYNAMVHGQM